jgi:hypothetical protein
LNAAKKEDNGGSASNSGSGSSDIVDFDPKLLMNLDNTPIPFTTTIEVKENEHKQCEKCKIFYPRIKNGCQNQACPVYVGRLTPNRGKVTPVHHPISITDIPSPYLMISHKPSSHTIGDGGTPKGGDVPAIPTVDGMGLQKGRRNLSINGNMSSPARVSLSKDALKNLKRENGASPRTVCVSLPSHDVRVVDTIVKPTSPSHNTLDVPLSHDKPTPPHSHVFHTIDTESKNGHCLSDDVKSKLKSLSLTDADISVTSPTKINSITAPIVPTSGIDVSIYNIVGSDCTLIHQSIPKNSKCEPTTIDVSQYVTTCDTTSSTTNVSQYVSTLGHLCTTNLIPNQLIDITPYGAVATIPTKSAVIPRITTTPPIVKVTKPPQIIISKSRVSSSVENSKTPSASEGCNHKPSIGPIVSKSSPPSTPENGGNINDEMTNIVQNLVMDLASLPTHSNVEATQKSSHVNLDCESSTLLPDTTPDTSNSDDDDTIPAHDQSKKSPQTLGTYTTSNIGDVPIIHISVPHKIRNNTKHRTRVDCISPVNAYGTVVTSLSPVVNKPESPVINTNILPPDTSCKTIRVPCLRISSDTATFTHQLTSPATMTYLDKRITTHTDPEHPRKYWRRGYIYVDQVDGIDDEHSREYDTIPYKSIDSAVSKASPGDIIVVSEGIYPHFTAKDLIFKGHPHRTILESADVDSCFFSNVYINNLTVEGKNEFDNVTFTGDCIGIKCVNDTTLVFNNNVFDVSESKQQEIGKPKCLIETDYDTVVVINNSSIKSNIPLIFSTHGLNVSITNSKLELSSQIVVATSPNCKLDIEYSNIVTSRSIIVAETPSVNISFSTLTSGTKSSMFGADGGEVIFNNCILKGKNIKLFDNKGKSVTGYFSGTVEPKSLIVVPDSYSMYTFLKNTQSAVSPTVQSLPTILDGSVDTYNVKSSDVHIIFNDKGTCRKVIIINLNGDADLGAEVCIKHAGSKYNSQLCVTSKENLDGVCDIRFKSQFISSSVCKTYIYMGEKVGWVTKN